MSKSADGSERRTAQRRRRQRRATDVNSVEILESMSDGFAAVDREWRYTYVNRAAERNARLGRDEMLGRTLWEVFPEFVGSQFESACRRAMDEGVTVHFEEYCAPLDSWFEQTIYPAADGITVYVRDITERKRAEQASRFLADASKSLAALVDYGSTMQKVARLAVPFFADWCAVDLVEASGSLRRVAFIHRDPAREAAGHAAAAMPGASAPLSPREAVRSARTFVRLLGEPEPQRSPDEARALAALGHASWIVVPIAGRVRVLGALTVGQASPERAFGEDSVAWVRDLARRAALEVENARLHDMVQRSREQASRATVRGKLLQEVAASLSEALTPTEVSETVVARAREALKAPWWTDWDVFHQGELQAAMLGKKTPLEAVKASAAEAKRLKAEFKK